ncbi:MAG: CTP pyrophosphohydrolase [Candidatus Anoxychlamydiales bacterium]|nr:CTP pyrophosphohydrolase [Candidatus Anoxychlamydiales bacterium]
MNKSSIEIYDYNPQKHRGKIEVVGCYIEIDESLLLLQLANQKLEAGFWGVPAGKVEQNESPKKAAKRELFEETGIDIEDLAHIKCLGALYVKKPNVDYIFHLFKIQLHKTPIIQLSIEHQDYKWARMQDIDKMPLVEGALEALQKYKNYTQPNLEKS